MPPGTKFRQFIKKHFVIIYLIFVLIGLITTGLGGIFYYRFISAPSYSFKYGFSGFGIARNNTDILPAMMVVGVGIDLQNSGFNTSFNALRTVRTISFSFSLLT